MSKMSELHAEIVGMLYDEMPITDIARILNVPLEFVISVEDDLNKFLDGEITE